MSICWELWRENYKIYNFTSQLKTHSWEWDIQRLEESSRAVQPNDLTGRLILYSVGVLWCAVRKADESKKACHIEYNKMSVLSQSSLKPELSTFIYIYHVIYSVLVWVWMRFIDYSEYVSNT